MSLAGTCPLKLLVTLYNNKTMTAYFSEPSGCSLPTDDQAQAFALEQMRVNRESERRLIQGLGLAALATFPQPPSKKLVEKFHATLEALVDAGLAVCVDPWPGAEPGFAVYQLTEAGFDHAEALDLTQAKSASNC